MHTRLTSAALVIVLCGTLLAADKPKKPVEPEFTDEEKRLVNNLAEPERLYVEHALKHSTDEWSAAQNRQDWTVGDIGPLKFSRVRMQVIDPTTVAVTSMKFIPQTFAIGQDPPPNRYKAGETYWISGLDTARLSDDDTRLELPGDAVFIFTGSQQHETILGTDRTARHLTLINTDEAQPVVEKLLENRNARTWTIDNKAVRARLKSSLLSSGNLKLERFDGQIVSVKQKSLSDADREWLSAARKSRQQELNEKNR